MSDRILIVDDEAEIADLIEVYLSNENFTVFKFYSAAEALECINKTELDLAILDMQLPDGSGREIASALKSADIPVLYVTVVDDEDEIVRSFDDGAADYITKPFRMRELLARIKRALHEKDNGEILKMGEAVIDVEAGKVRIKDREISLTALEYRLLLVFAQNQSVLLKREQILERIWDISGNFVEDNTLTVYVKRLREKLGDAVSITTVRGIGYRVG